VLVDAAVAFQSFIGIGGALTDASAETFAKLPEAQRKELLTAYYDPIRGIGTTWQGPASRAAIFPAGAILYQRERQPAEDFSVAHDEQYRIPSSSRR